MVDKLDCMEKKMWLDKPYYSLNYYLKEVFGEKVYRIALDGYMSCPNRDGKIGTGGCIFCSEGGSGDFTPHEKRTISEQIEAGKELISKKYKGGKYIAYFQAYTNTYASVEYLEKIFTEAMSHPEIVALSIATRPDCLPEDVLELLERLSRIKPIMVELGLQTIHDKTANFIRRGYELSCFDKAVQELKNRNISVITHLIIGLPGETREDVLASVKYLNKAGVNGVKLQLLHILKNTELAGIYERGECTAMEMDEYLDLLIECVEHLSQDIVIHRLTGDGPKKLLIAPAWSGDKKKVLNRLHMMMKERDSWQGKKI